MWIRCGEFASVWLCLCVLRCRDFLSNSLSAHCRNLSDRFLGFDLSSPSSGQRKPRPRDTDLEPEEANRTRGAAMPPMQSVQEEKNHNNHNNDNNNNNNSPTCGGEDGKRESAPLTCGAVDRVAEEEAGQSSGVRLAFGVVLGAVLPLAAGLLRGVRGIAASRQSLAHLIASVANTTSLNLASVQVSHHIGLMLKLLKMGRSAGGLGGLSPNGGSSQPSSAETAAAAPLYSPSIREPSGSHSLPPFGVSRQPASLADQQAAPKCCTLNVLAQPPPGQPIRADIVFIHGLHGSQVNTWKQGRWRDERHPVEFERPPKPPVRPPKRPRHSRSAVMRPPHQQKRARFARSELPLEASSDREGTEEPEEDEPLAGQRTPDPDERTHDRFGWGEPSDIRLYDGIESSLPTFRLRTNDNGRLLRAELQSVLDGDSSTRPRVRGSRESEGEENAPKASADDPDDDPQYSRCWPGDWLPLDCPGVRVIALNYTTDQYLWRPLWKRREPRTNLAQRSREMAELLVKHRVGCGQPIVWVGHSKGGLFVKQLIVDAWESGRPAMAPFWRSARGVFFYSVPHRGSHLASVKAPLLTRSVELVDIEKNSKYLLDLHRRFVGLYHLGHLRVEVFSFVEMAMTLMSVLYLRIVGVDSADPGIGDVCGIRLDHREICKPRSRNCILYRELVKMIHRVC